MKDVLENLRKLPPQCVAVIDGQVVMIKRGAGKALHPLPAGQVDQWNHRWGITPEQVQAMIVGVTMGWDRDGADPETHIGALASEVPEGPFEYSFDVDFSACLKTTAMTAEEAEEKLKATAGSIEIAIEALMEEHPEIEGFGATGDGWDINETTDPRV